MALLVLTSLAVLFLAGIYMMALHHNRGANLKAPPVGGGPPSWSSGRTGGARRAKSNAQMSKLVCPQPCASLTHQSGHHLVRRLPSSWPSWTDWISG